MILEKIEPLTSLSSTYVPVLLPVRILDGKQKLTLAYLIMGRCTGGWQATPRIVETNEVLGWGRPVRTGWTLLPLPLPHCTLSTVFSRLDVRCVSLALYWSHVGAPATSRGDEGTSALLGPPSKVGLCIFNCDSAPEMSPCGSHGFTGITLSTQMFGLVCCLT